MEINFRKYLVNEELELHLESISSSLREMTDILKIYYLYIDKL